MVIRTLATAALVAAAATPALAADRVIRLSDFDFNNPSEIARFEDVVAREARLACAVAGRQTLAELTEARACRREAIDSAMAQAGLKPVVDATNKRSSDTLIASK